MSVWEETIEIVSASQKIEKPVLVTIKKESAALLARNSTNKEIKQWMKIQILLGAGVHF